MGAPAVLTVALLCLCCARPTVGRAHLHEVLTHKPMELGEGITRFILNVGSHDSPPEPTDAKTAVVAVEPLPEVAARIPHVPNRFVLTTAVGVEPGLSFLNHHLDSSSLLDNNLDGNDLAEIVAGKGLHGAKVLVPVLPLAYLIHSFAPAHCWFLKTDMQGYDFQAVKSAGAALQRCSWVFAEVYCNGQMSYVGAENSFEHHWHPYMTELGFELSGPDPCADGQPTETNALFRNAGSEHTIHDKPDHGACPYCYS